MSQASSRVGIRELRQNLSVYLRRVRAGETLEVTDHNQPVARITPALERGSAIERLYAAGRIVSLATGNLADLPPPKPLPPGTMSLSDALQEQKEERL
jgi:prevent-host-death family protein